MKRRLATDTQTHLPLLTRTCAECNSGLSCTLSSREESQVSQGLYKWHAKDHYQDTIQCVVNGLSGALKKMLKQSAIVAILVAILTVGFSELTPASALTPLRSAEQLALDEILFARASRGIEVAAMRCFSAPPTRQKKPIKIRFFLAGLGKQLSQLRVLEPRPASTAMRRAAFRAIRTCVPYSIPDELTSRGGFWVTITFK
jgi:hypothetical protein